MSLSNNIYKPDQTLREIEWPLVLITAVFKPIVALSYKIFDFKDLIKHLQKEHTLLDMLKYMKTFEI